MNTLSKQKELFDQVEPDLKKWTMFPTGRWASMVLSHGGWIALHAWVDGSWAITRGKPALKSGDPFLIGSREQGQPKGEDLRTAMNLAEAAAAEIVERERKACQKQ